MDSLERMFPRGKIGLFPLLAVLNRLSVPTILLLDTFNLVSFVTGKSCEECRITSRRQSRTTLPHAKGLTVTRNLPFKTTNKPLIRYGEIAVVPRALQ